jgi:hypothetical protein
MVDKVEYHGRLCRRCRGDGGGSGGAGWRQHLLHASSVSILYGLGAVGIRTPDTLVAANDSVAEIRAFQAGESIRGGGLRHINAVEAAERLRV